MSFTRLHSRVRANWFDGIFSKIYPKAREEVRRCASPPRFGLLGYSTDAYQFVVAAIPLLGGYDWSGACDAPFSGYNRGFSIF